MIEEVANLLLLSAAMLPVSLATGGAWMLSRRRQGGALGRVWKSACILSAAACVALGGAAVLILIWN